MKRHLMLAVLFLALVTPSLFAQHLAILLPERARFLEDQRFDLVIEVRNVSDPSGFRVMAQGTDITGLFGGPKQADLDCDGTRDFVYRADLMSFKTPGAVYLEASIQGAGATLRANRRIGIQAFSLVNPARNIILFIGDAMAEAYRDAARLVARSVEVAPGVPGLREGPRRED